MTTGSNSPPPANDQDRWDNEKQCRFYLSIQDPATGKRKRRLIGHVDAYPILHPECMDLPDKFPIIGEQVRLSHSKLFDGLKGKPFLAAHFVGRLAIGRYWQERDHLPIWALPASYLRILHGMSARVRAIVKRLREMQPRVARIEQFPLLYKFYVSGYLETAVRALGKFEERAKDPLSSSDIRRYNKTHAYEIWPFGVHGLSYALFRLLTEHSLGSIRAYVAYRRIGEFQRDFLHRKIGDSSGDTLETVRVQVRSFRRSAQRRDVDRTLARLLTAEWFGYRNPAQVKRELS
jgi:hypothetical protein